MGELEDKLKSIMNDPGQMEKITKLAQSLMGGEQGGGKPLNSSDSAPGGISPGKLGGLINAVNGRGGRDRALLEAMKPYLSEKRRAKMDKAMKLARLADLAGIAMGEMGDKDV